MAKASKEMLQSAVIGFGIPALLLLALLVFFVPQEQKTQQQPSGSTQGSVPSTAAAERLPSGVEIAVLVDGETVKMDLEAYVVGVVLAEMPASFEMEALKAQAVAARTYVLKTCSDGQKHGGAVCTSYQCCQAYMSQEDYLQRGWSERYIQRVYDAVSATAGEVLIYDGKLIRATYFSCSGGCTEDALAVWGRDYPYLQSVKSPGEEESVYYTDTKEFTPEELQDALGVSLTGLPQSWFGQITYTQGGGVETVQIGGVTYRGTTLRSLLGLRSTVFQIVVNQERILFETKGYGHRVGMSQYGADAMAMEGSDYRQILAHYYCDTTLTNYDQLLSGDAA